MPRQLEERSVALKDAKAGVALEAGHPVLLIIDGAKGNPAAKREPDDFAERSGAQKPLDALSRRALEKGPPDLAGDPDAQRVKGPLSVQGARWGRDAAAIGDEVELSAEVNGDDVSGLEFRIRDPANETVATLTPEVTGTRAQVRWKVPASESAGESYDFGAWVKADCLNRSGKLAVADLIHAQLVDDYTGEPLAGCMYQCTLHDGSVREGTTDDDGFMLEENVPPGTYEVTIVSDLDVFDTEGGEINHDVKRGPKAPLFTDAPPIETKHVHVASVTAKPAAALAGEKVTLRASVLGAEGETLVFRAYRAGETQPLALVEATVSGGVASAEWTVPDGEGKHEGAFEVTEYALEAECMAVIASARLALRGFRKVE